MTLVANRSKKEFKIFWLPLKLTDISLGVHFDLKAPRLEVHLPFGFAGIGWEETGQRPLNAGQIKTKYLFGRPWL